jgi:ribokinase
MENKKNFMNFMKMYDITTFGSATTDIFIDTELPEIYCNRKELIAYKVGSKIIIKKIDFLIGGGAVNTAIGFARLGLKTACISKLGENNLKILDVLKKEGVKFLGKKTSGIGGYSVILDSKEHNRTILNYRGLNDNITMKDIKLERIKQNGFI